MDLFYVYLCSSLSCLVLAVSPIFRRYSKIKYYESLPNSLKDKNGLFRVDKNIVKLLEKNHKNLIRSAQSKFASDRGPARILLNKEVADRVERYAYVYFDDFTEEISDGLLDWNNENTELFFKSMYQDYGVTNRALLTTLLYLTHEIKYFNFRDSLMRNPPESLNELLEKKIMYEETNEEEPVTKYEVKRLACELGLGIPVLPMHIALHQTKKSLKAKQFSKDFMEQESKVKDSAYVRLVKSSWEETVSSKDEKIDISEESYQIVNQDFSRRNRLESFFKKHLKYALVDHFGSECVDCKTKTNLQLDHFWLPKVKGGNFAMRSKQGHYVNNCIPMCQSCNAKKGAKPIYDYFEPDKMMVLLEKSQKFDAFLNEHLQNFKDPDFNVIPRANTAKQTEVENKQAA